MHRYINAAVNMTETVKFSGVVDIISPKTLDDRIIVTNDFSFFREFCFCPIDTNCNQYVEQFDKFEDFGMIVKENCWIIPAGMKFSITFDGYGEHNTEFYLLSHNGVSIVEDCGVGDYFDLSVTFTPFGYSCYLASLDLKRPFIKVVEDMLVYSQYFDLL